MKDPDGISHRPAYDPATGGNSLRTIQYTVIADTQQTAGDGDEDTSRNRRWDSASVRSEKIGRAVSSPIEPPTQWVWRWWRVSPPSHFFALC